MRCVAGAWLFPLLLATARALASDRVGDIEFFGYKGLAVAQVRQSLPIHEGDEYSDETKNQIRRAVRAAIGKDATDVAAICCDVNRKRLIFIGLPGASAKSFVYNPEPRGRVRLPPDIIDLYRRLDHALEAAVRRGGEAAQEDDSQAYSLVKDPSARSLELAVRQWAIEHERDLLQVLEYSSAVELGKRNPKFLAFCFLDWGACGCTPAPWRRREGVALLGYHSEPFRLNDLNIKTGDSRASKLTVEEKE